MATARILPRESDLYAELVGFYDVANDPNNPANYPSNAAVTVTIVDAAEANVAGAVNLAMAYVAGTVGPDTLYRGVIPSTVVLLKNTKYTAKVVAVVGGSKHTFRVDFTAGP
jgi:hypothetical protein